jgi:hypothetical protein
MAAVLEAVVSSAKCCCAILQARAAVLTASQCATYDEIKQAIIRVTGAKDSFPTHIASSMVTGLVTTTATAPVDVIKTHMFVGMLCVSLCKVYATLILSCLPTHKMHCSVIAACPCCTVKPHVVH